MKKIDCIELRHAKEVKVIKTVVVKGSGIKEDPFELVAQYWDHDGRLLGEIKESVTDSESHEIFGKDVLVLSNE
ncbi:MAG: hypothetical protein ACYCDV_00565, partial [Facklamia hominis]